MKPCTICGVSKPYSEFHRQASRASGYGDWCKPCKKQKKAKQYLANRDELLRKSAVYRKLNPEKVSQAKARCYLNKKEQYAKQHKEYYLANRQDRLRYSDKYRAENAAAIRERGVSYHLRNRARLNEKQKLYYLKNRAARIAYGSRYVRNRLDTDPLYALTYIVRRRVTLAIANGGYTKKSKTRDMLGCEWPQLFNHLESQFKLGMTWANRGKWHIDHMIPLASAKTEQELVALCHYKNLQPLWAFDNLSKGAKLAYSQAA